MIIVNYSLVMVDVDLGGGVIFFVFEEMIYVFDEVYYFFMVVCEYVLVVVMLKGVVSWLEKFN